MGQVTIVRDHAAASRATCVSTERSNAAVLLGRIAKPGKGADTTDYSTAQADIPALNGSNFVTYTQIGARLDLALADVRTAAVESGNNLENHNDQLSQLGLPYTQNQTATTYQANLRTLIGLSHTPSGSDYAAVGAGRDAGQTFSAPGGFDTLVGNLRAGPTVDVSDVGTLGTAVSRTVTANQNAQTAVVAGSPAALRGAFRVYNFS